MERATKTKSPAKKAVRKTAETATRKTPEAKAAAKTRRTASLKGGLLKAEFSEEAVKSVFVSASSAEDYARTGPGTQPSPERYQPLSGRTSRVS